jgi:phage tail-like protein
MDTNGLRFWLLADEASFDQVFVSWDDARRRLRLANEREGFQAQEGLAVATGRLGLPPMARDQFGNLARASGIEVFVRSVLGDESLFWDGTTVHGTAVHDAITDVALSGDGVLTLADGTRLVLVDLRDRFAPLVLTHGTLKPWRIAPRPGGAWLLGQDRVSLGYWTGTTWTDRPPVTPSPGTFRPEPENHDAPRLVDVPLVLDVGEKTAALASHADGGVAVITWTPAGTGFMARVRRFDALGKAAAPVVLNGVQGPFSAAWLDEARLAVLYASTDAVRVPEALIFKLDEPELLRDGADVAGDFYPLVGWDGGPFVHTEAAPPHYALGATRSKPLHRLSLPSLRRTGVVYGAALDSGEDTTVWHRLYLEADVPEGTGLVVDAIASASAERPVEWEAERAALLETVASAPYTSFPGYPHVVGDVKSAPLGPLDRPVEEQRIFNLQTPLTRPPRFSWSSQRSELPFHDGLLVDNTGALCTPVPDRTGLFTVLLQRTGLVTRGLRGRYLHLRITFHGNGRTTPEIAAVRAWGSRFSYVQRYLPELFHETELGPDGDAGEPALLGSEVADQLADAVLPATAPDFLERFVSTFESVLTPLEDRIASSWMLTDPRTVPAESLEWLADWIGMSFAPEHDEDTRRRLLRVAPELARTRGTVAGLKLAIEAVTNGSITRGEVVVVEDWRLRRTFATLLGVDLADEADPLLGGVVHSGNSIVGDTLILGQTEREELLALFNVTTRTPSEQQAVIEFYRRTAWRVSVLVHRDLSSTVRRWIREAVSRLVPAHVLGQVLPASRGLIVGVATLVGVDTWLGKAPQPGSVKLDTTVLGRGDRLHRPISLDPRLEGGTGS